MTIFKKIGIPTPLPVLLAPLAGVSDHPFRRVCTALGADLSFVEMLSAHALIYRNKRTFEMAKRHPSEALLGVQLTGPDATSIAEAVRILDGEFNFEVIDINMGCPVQKVVKTGCGSALLKDPKVVFDVISRCREATSRPLTAKIRLGFDHTCKNAVTVARALAEAGADWITVHGRTRSDDYSRPVDLHMIAAVKDAVPVPVVGNGNLFSAEDVALMQSATKVDGVMISRGALGDPWLFAKLKGESQEPTLDQWLHWVSQHLRWQAEEYGTETQRSAICMRKHLLWYCKGWAQAKRFKDAMARCASLQEAEELIHALAAEVRRQGQERRFAAQESTDGRFQWDPKWEMDRQLDRGSECLQL